MSYDYVMTSLPAVYEEHDEDTESLGEGGLRGQRQKTSSYICGVDTAAAGVPPRVVVPHPVGVVVLGVCVWTCGDGQNVGRMSTEERHKTH